MKPKEASAKYAKKLLAIEKRHFEKYGNRTMSLKELDAICGIKNHRKRKRLVVRAEVVRELIQIQKTGKFRRIGNIRELFE